MEDDLWYLPVNALAGLGLLLVGVSRTEDSHDTCDIGGDFDFVGVRAVLDFWDLIVRVA